MTTATPAQRLLGALGPVSGLHGDDDLGAFGLPSGATSEEMLGPHAQAGEFSRLGPLRRLHVFWFAGMSCDGCTVSVTGAESPSLESLLLGAHPGAPRIVLHSSVTSMESGPNYMKAHEQALAGTLEDPYAIVLEESISDELSALQTSEGHSWWSWQGEQPWAAGGALRPVSIEEWIARLAPGAAAAIAIGTCATWGGVARRRGQPDRGHEPDGLPGKDYRSAFGLPVVNVPGCAPVGDNFTETVAAICYFLQGFGPLPEFDDLGRPAWLFGETVHRHCVRGAYYEEGVYASEFGDKECLVEIGCWGPVVNCNITSRGAIRGTASAIE